MPPKQEKQLLLESQLKKVLDQTIHIARKKIKVKKNVAELQEMLTDYRENLELVKIIFNDKPKKTQQQQFHTNDQPMISVQEYRKLQQNLQKYQELSRSHIKNEQLLKLYCEELQQKNREYQKSNQQLLKGTKENIKTLKRQNQVLLQSNRMLQSQNQKLHRILQTNKLSLLEKKLTQNRKSPLIQQNFVSIGIERKKSSTIKIQQRDTSSRMSQGKQKRPSRPSSRSRKQSIKLQERNLQRIDKQYLKNKKKSMSQFKKMSRDSMSR